MVGAVKQRIGLSDVARHRRSDLGLGAFLAELDERLQALGPAGVRGSLRVAAARLSPSERPAFQAIFEADAPVRSDDHNEEIDAVVAGHPALAVGSAGVPGRLRDRHHGVHRAVCGG